MLINGKVVYIIFKSGLHVNYIQCLRAFSEGDPWIPQNFSEKNNKKFGSLAHQKNFLFFCAVSFFPYFPHFSILHPSNPLHKPLSAPSLSSPDSSHSFSQIPLSSHFSSPNPIFSTKKRDTLSGVSQSHL